MKIALTVAAVAALFGSAANAQDLGPPAAPNKLYNYLVVNLGLGAGGETDVSASGTVNGISGSGSVGVGLDPGFFGSVGVGHAFGNGLSVEAEGYYLYNSAQKDDLLGLDAHVDSYGGLVSAIYHPPIPLTHGTQWTGPILPYVGAGVGYGGVRYNIEGVSTDDDGLVWQARAGISQALAGGVWDFGYRYLETPEWKVSGSVANISGTLKLQSRVHIISLGWRQYF